MRTANPKVRRVVSKALAETTLTLQEAATRIGIPYPTAQAYRLGRRTAQPQTVAKIVRFLRKQAKALTELAERLEAEAERSD